MMAYTDIEATAPRVTWSVSGIAGALAGHDHISCDGCRAAPWPDCAACGRPAVTALVDRDFEHSMSLCARCWAVALAIRIDGGAPDSLVSGRKPLRNEPVVAYSLTPTPAAGKHDHLPDAGKKVPKKRQKPAHSVSAATTRTETREPSPTTQAIPSDSRVPSLGAMSEVKDRAPSRKMKKRTTSAPDAPRIPAPRSKANTMPAVVSTSPGVKRASTGRGRSSRRERKAIGNGR